MKYPKLNARIQVPWGPDVVIRRDYLGEGVLTDYLGGITAELLEEVGAGQGTAFKILASAKNHKTIEDALAELEGKLP